MTATIYRQGHTWEAECEVDPEQFDDDYSFMAVVIALLDESVDRGVREHG